MANHQSSVQYHFSDRAYEIYRKAHDKLVDMKAATTNEDLQGIYAKARGYVARLSMIIHTLEQALIIVEGSGTVSAPCWIAAIDASAVEAVAQLPQYSRHPRLLMVEPDQDGLIAPSTIVQKHISQCVNGSYPVQRAVELMETVEKLGFEKVVPYETPTSKSRGKD